MFYLFGRDKPLSRAGTSNEYHSSGNGPTKV